MDQFVECLNIEHFRKMLATETDDSKRETLLSRLAEEVAKLAALAATKESEKRRTGT
jgi:hypothetical protein